MLALVAAKEAATLAPGHAATLAPGHGVAMMPSISASTLDGFAAGMLLSGAVFLLLMAQRHSLRRVLRSARPSWRAGGLPPGASFERDDPRPEDKLSTSEDKLSTSEDNPTAPEDGLSTPADAPSTSGVPGSSGEHGQRRPPGYRSKHRLAGPEDSRPWPENHRRAPRHAAPSSALFTVISRMLGLMQFRLLGAGD